MYEYNKLSKEEKYNLVQERLSQNFPAHSPPHPLPNQGYYLLTATCYQHKHHMQIVDSVKMPTERTPRKQKTIANLRQQLFISETSDRPETPG